MKYNLQETSKTARLFLLEGIGSLYQKDNVLYRQFMRQLKKWCIATSLCESYLIQSRNHPEL